ncbi:UNVERIFIED_ORG: hypothetical protein J2Y78_004864 [Buttiauxella agrestis ATCC 33320]
MKEGFYWIQVDGQVQIARYVSQLIEDMETGEIVNGSWEFTGTQPGIINTRDVEVLSDLLTPP